MCPQRKQAKNENDLMFLNLRKINNNEIKINTESKKKKRISNKL